MAHFNFSKFLALSASLNYQLSNPELGYRNILAIISGPKRLPEKSQKVLLEVMDYLGKAYGQKRRQLGPLAVLHPLRATAMLARVEDQISLLDLLSELLHDKFEDIKPDDYSAQVWEELETEFRCLVKQIDPRDEWYLMERLEALTRKEEEESYSKYIGRLLERARKTPELVRVKLADRLDNTLDMRIDLEDPLEDLDFFAFLFKLLFVKNYQGYKTEIPHPPHVPFYGARRLYELYKNTVVLSLVRQKADSFSDPPALLLFEEIASCSMAEAQRLILHVFSYHLPDLATQRQLMLRIMTSLQENTGSRAKTTTAEKSLQVLSAEHFDSLDPRLRMERLDRLYQDKYRMIEAAVCFIVVFLNFLQDRDYYLSFVTTGTL